MLLTSNKAKISRIRGFMFYMINLSCKYIKPFILQKNAQRKEIKSMEIKKSTLVRTVALIIVVTNYILKYFGYDVLNVNENDIMSFVEMVVSIAVIILNFWKNNSFTNNAIMADKYLEELKKFNEG